MTVEELKKVCEREIKDGKGDNEVILCVNGDEFHSLDAGFSSPIYNATSIDDFMSENGYGDGMNVSVLN